MPKQAPVPADPRLTITQAAEYVGHSRLTVRRRIADGSLPADRSGPKILKVRKEDLDRIFFRRLPTTAHASGDPT